MSRKKLSDMTPIERVDQRMKGMSWEEAEDVGVEILARCLSFHVHVREDGEEYIDNLLKRIFGRAIKWTEEHSYTLAMARVGLKLKTIKEAKINENK